ncbi:hypothetical protein MNBD_UNCLBAC01-2063 [hydrothermal vent metagenome]|uniref:Uncharacterized protein n=1 Tax=hydrothermal vent metagenome TaxID=652676 RepID=A0A3B1E3A6_9ZZZZ
MINQWEHLTNTTDDMLLKWHNTSALKKLQWLEDVHQLYKKAVPKKKQIFYRDFVRQNSK